MLGETSSFAVEGFNGKTLINLKMTLDGELIYSTPSLPPGLRDITVNGKTNLADFFNERLEYDNEGIGRTSPPVCADYTTTGDGILRLRFGVSRKYVPAQFPDPEISCNNGIRDGNEQGVDCGGDCITDEKEACDGIDNDNDCKIDEGGVCETEDEETPVSPREGKVSSFVSENSFFTIISVILVLLIFTVVVWRRWLS